mgnify:CR=1 FL=1
MLDRKVHIKPNFNKTLVWLGGGFLERKLLINTCFSTQTPQTMSHKWSGLTVILIPLALLLLTAFVSVLTETPVGDFTRDPAYLGDLSPFSGVISNLGVLCWCAGSVVCLVGWTLLSKQKTQSKLALFFLLAGLYTALLMLDDLFLLHEEIFPAFLPFGEKFIISGYGLLLISGLYYFREIIWSSKYHFLLLAVGFFAMSVGIDLVQDEVEVLVGKWRILFEDGFKFLGIVSWLAYFWENMHIAINEIMNSTVE